MKICQNPAPPVFSLFTNFKNRDWDTLEEDGYHFLGFDESCLSQVRKVFPAPATHTINDEKSIYNKQRFGVVKISIKILNIEGIYVTN
jgi:hypothetical protein